MTTELSYRYVRGEIFMKHTLVLSKIRQRGFTLIELLVVIAIITALAVVVFVALDPAGRLEEARDARRTADVEAILTAIHQYIVDNKGITTGLGLGTAELQIGTAASGCAISTGGCSVAAAACVDLSTDLAPYLKEIPIDPTAGTTFTAAETGYAANLDTNGIVTVKACGTEGTTNISASR